MAASSPLAESPAVLVVQDHSLVRSGLREVLGRIGERIELLEGSCPEEGLSLLAKRPDVDLIFLDLDSRDGLAFIRHFRAAAPAVPLVLYTMRQDERTLQEALAFGAAGVIPKTHSKTLVLKAIELVMEGGIYIPPQLARLLASRPRTARRRAEAAPKLMSRQQWRIVELIAQGLPNKEIARRLGLASSTVKNQLTVVFHRLQVSNRTQAAIAVRTLGQVRKY
jgi:DNA-binding NarL/FixJ family response regulator